MDSKEAGAFKRNMSVFLPVTIFYSLLHFLSVLKVLKKKALENIVGKGENAGNQHFLLFPLCFLLNQGGNCSVLATFSLLSAKAFNLDWSKILSFGKGLIKIDSKEAGALKGNMSIFFANHKSLFIHSFIHSFICYQCQKVGKKKRQMKQTMCV